MIPAHISALATWTVKSKTNRNAMQNLAVKHGFANAPKLMAECGKNKELADKLVDECNAIVADIKKELGVVDAAFTPTPAPTPAPTPQAAPPEPVAAPAPAPAPEKEQVKEEPAPAPVEKPAPKAKPSSVTVAPSAYGALEPLIAYIVSEVEKRIKLPAPVVQQVPAAASITKDDVQKMVDEAVAASRGKILAAVGEILSK